MTSRLIAATLVAALLLGGLTPTASAAASGRPAPRRSVYTPRKSVYAPRVSRYTPRIKDEKPQRTAPRTVTVGSDILFAFNSSTLGPQAARVLAEVVTRLDHGPVGRVVVTGYTDSIGTRSYNLGLSLRRAQSVLRALRAVVHRRGLSYVAVGKGEADSVAPNRLSNGADNPAGRAKNRRVTVQVP
jgi:outer membrane protein OmpA-like peptidoglycan-associated protein